jgi:hypothetical protein
MQKTDVTHETPASVFAELADVGLGIVVHVDALTCAGTVSPWGVDAWTASDPRTANGSAISVSAHPIVTTRTADRMTTSAIRRPSFLWAISQIHREQR